MTNRWARMASAIAWSLLLPLFVSSGPALAYEPLVVLPANGLGGQAALDAVGADLAKVAEANGRTAQELKRLLLQDPTLKLDRFGWAYYAEDLSQVPATLPAESAAGTEPIDLSSTFRLHSLNGVSRRIVLNFNGGTITGTGWNEDNGLPQITLPPFDLDGDPTRFSDEELKGIHRIWQRVAEDFSPFLVDVTTDTSRTTEYPAITSTVMITRSAGFSPCNCPAVSYASHSGDGSFGPAFVFADRLHGNTKFIAEASSHALGHWLGLDHDGTATSTQYRGHGNWAPIMGNNYAASVTQFSKGEYRDANNTQDDIGIISRSIRLNTDGNDNTLADARSLLSWGNDDRYVRSSEERISGPDDYDLFVIAAGTGPITVKVQHRMAGGNADLLVALLDDLGRPLRLARQPADANAEADLISYNNPHPGTYYLRVGAAGFGRPSTGYGTYGSRGLYKLTVGFPSSRHKPPTASIATDTDIGISPMSVTFDGGSTANSGAIRYFWTFGNGSRSETGNNRTPTATYSAPGSYTATLRVVDAMGFSAMTSKPITVGAGLQRPQVTWSVVREPITVFLNGSGRIVLGTSLSYSISKDLRDASGRPLPTANADVYLGSSNTTPAYRALPSQLALEKLGAKVSSSFDGKVSAPAPCVERSLLGIKINGIFYLPQQYDVRMGNCR